MWLRDAKFAKRVDHPKLSESLLCHPKPDDPIAKVATDPFKHMGRKY